MVGILNDMLVNKLFLKGQIVSEGLYPTDILYPGNDILPAGKVASGTNLKKIGLRWWFKKNSII